MAFGYVLLGLLAVQGAPANGQAFVHDEDFLYDPNNCSAEPAYDRTFLTQRITWKGHEYLFVDEGNDLKIFDIDDPLNPTAVSLSHFGIPYFGDVDYNITNFSVCDDCRFGVLTHRSGTLMFDLGTGATPSFGADDDTESAPLVEGAFTFSHGGQQYLVAASLGSTPCTNNKSGLYAFNGVDEALNPLLHCLDADGTGVEVVNGLVVADSPNPTLYLVERLGLFRIFSLQTAPTFSLAYEGNGGIVRTFMRRTRGIATDESVGLLAVLWSGELSIYDIGWATGSPTSPVLLHYQELTSRPDANSIGLRYPILFTSQVYSTDSPLTFDVTAPTAPIPLDQGFWDPSHAWNNFSTCLWANSVSFSVDGNALYLSRYAALQVIDVSSIQPPQCGDGVLDLNDACDDGNTSDGDGCSITCQVESGWTCSGEPSVCVPTTTASCGDGLIQSGEACDDGNTYDGDGCSAACQPESGWTCSGEPSVCVPTSTSCGDGHIDVAEQCDDGNQTSADGCSGQCQVESGWTCVGQPSVCTESDPGAGSSSGGCGCNQRSTPPAGLSAVGLVALLLWLLGGPVRRRRKR